MQPHLHGVSALLAVLAVHLFPASAVLLSTAAAESKAVAWLQAHGGAPQPDDLAELKVVNPEAYGIVKALLTKRSLGLLDPRHPTASFAPARTPPSEDVASGAAAFAKIAEESGEKPKAPAPYPDAVGASHHDWLAWKPQQSAVDDEAMVQNVLGSVAALKGGDVASRTASDDIASEDIQPLKSSANADVPSQQAQEAPQSITSPRAPLAAPLASMNQENSYLKGIDFGLAPQPTHQHPSAAGNSYLRGIDFGDDSLSAKSFPATEREAKQQPIGLNSMKNSQSSGSYLSSFNWDDDALAAKSQLGDQTPSRPVDTPQASIPRKPSGHPKDALLAWLNPKKAKQVVSAEQHHAAPLSADDNSYLKDLNLN